jgi:hypothetical protein
MVVFLLEIKWLFFNMNNICPSNIENNNNPLILDEKVNTAQHPQQL